MINKINWAHSECRKYYHSPTGISKTKKIKHVNVETQLNLDQFLNFKLKQMFGMWQGSISIQQGKKKRWLINK